MGKGLTEEIYMKLNQKAITLPISLGHIEISSHLGEKYSLNKYWLKESLMIATDTYQSLLINNLKIKGQTLTQTQLIAQDFTFNNILIETLKVPLPMKT